ncbi:MAG: hypothetical protein G01um101425_810 [Candidatus Peregrinibacteria bacterium Gr01-1014_25]|nr:MAG: hypothetical protein G01um101425_810 [Candidatus Peregrinibacteria bacterium Gr01-1014_25]
MAAQTPHTPEKAPTVPTLSPEQRVLQPAKTPGIEAILDQIDSMQISEKTGEDRSGDMGAGSGGAMTQTQGDTPVVSPRDQAIQNLPATQVMQRDIAKHITKEVRTLRRQAKTITRIGRPGQAFQLAQLYARIRKLNGLLAQIWEASTDVVKRMFIRIFIDKQPVL